MTLRPWIETFSLRSTVWLVLAALLLLTPRPQGCQRPLPLRVATFNIRNYPESQQQEEGAFLLLRQLQVSAAAVQEIRDPAAFAAAASRHLGPRWRFVFPDR